jgi:hypothetical protein
MTDGRQVLDFSAPVLFQTKDHRHRASRHLRSTAHRRWRTSSGAARDPDRRDDRCGGRRHRTLLAQRLAVPVRVLKNSLGELANGRLDYRIAETRKDEFASSTRSSTRRHGLELRYEEPPDTSTLSRH